MRQVARGENAMNNKCVAVHLANAIAKMALVLVFVLEEMDTLVWVIFMWKLIL